MSDLEKKVLDAIAERKLAPRPAYVFLAKRSVFWGLAAAAILFGALSVALLIYAVTDYFATGLRGLDNMPLDEFMPVLPVAWIACFAVFLLSASLGLKHTPRGYRFTTARLLAMALAASVALGAILHVTGASSAVHGKLTQWFPAYGRLTYVPFAEWSLPDQGRLGGTVMAVQEGKSLTLLDFQGAAWIIDISTADIRIDNPLLEEGDIAITGNRTGPLSFKATTIGEFD